MKTREWSREARSVASKFITREAGEEKLIEGYFSVFDSNYEIAPGMSESVAPGAFSETLSGDVRALTNHDTTLVLGRNKAGTLELKEDSRGLWGQIKVNSNDLDAVNLYERVKRGDVDQCSFGFDIEQETADYREDGSVHWTIEKVKLYEVSVCTFPAYDETSVSARSRDMDEHKKREAEAWKLRMKERIGHAESPNAQEEDH